jgi:hypothetical protein
MMIVSGTTLFAKTTTVSLRPQCSSLLLKRKNKNMRFSRSPRLLTTRRIMSRRFAAQTAETSSPVRFPL